MSTAPEARALPRFRARLAAVFLPGGGLDPARARVISTGICVVLLALGINWRFVDLAFPTTFSFDEHHFVENARNYINRVADWNDHPPLGKLLLIPGMRVFGDNGLGWRISSAIFGLVTIGLGYLIAVSLFRSKRAGLFAATFIAADGFFISYSRTALLDAPLTVFVFLAFYLMLEGRDLRWFLGAATAIGLAVAVKWTGGCVLLVAPLLLHRRGRSVLHVIWMGALAGALAAAIFALGLVITRQPVSLAIIWRMNLALLRHHAGFTVWDNGAASRWYTWPFLIHPVLLRFARVDGGRIRAMTTLGNPVLWYGSTAALLVAAARGVRQVIRRWRRGEPTDAWTRRAGLVIVTMFALIIQFVLTERESYIWHYLAPYGLALAFSAALMAEEEKRRPGLVLGLLVLVALASLYYYPVWTDSTIDGDGFVQRLIFPGWR
jgi:dolichyl-phosphate-mannose--protein O-mannosyl transferase